MEPTPRLAFSVSELATETSLSKQTIYKEIDEGRLRARRIRGRIVIPADAVDEWLKASA
jgi:excisionase family DNA binding protein